MTAIFINSLLFLYNESIRKKLIPFVFLFKVLFSLSNCHMYTISFFSLWFHSGMFCEISNLSNEMTCLVKNLIKNMPMAFSQ
jgi:hypothetical protein